MRTKLFFIFILIWIFFQTRQPIFAQLLGATFRVSQCSWLTLDQRLNVENCIRTLSEVAKSRDIPISSDLDIQVFFDYLCNGTDVLNRTSIVPSSVLRYVLDKGCST